MRGGAAAVKKMYDIGLMDTVLLFDLERVVGTEMLCRLLCDEVVCL